VVLAISFIRSGLGYGDGLFQGIFHAVMAFCNSGFATLPNGDLVPYAGNPAVNLALIALIILGGLGFPVLVNLYHYRQARRLTLHSKLVLITTAALILIGTLSVALLEWNNPATLGSNPIGTRLWMSLFQGVTPRTAGFSTVDYAQMRDPTLLLQVGLMFVGTAPSSTGGGVKVTTLALLVLVVLAQARGQGEEVSAFERRVPRQLIQKALVVLSFSGLLVLVATLALRISRLDPLAGYIRDHLRLRDDGTLHERFAGALHFRQTVDLSSNVFGTGWPDNPDPGALGSAEGEGLRLPAGRHCDRMRR
jgi:trk system potassium uptake protein TrkH